jgi:hypothetical protein
MASGIHCRSQRPIVDLDLFVAILWFGGSGHCVRHHRPVCAAALAHGGDVFAFGLCFHQA